MPGERPDEFLDVFEPWSERGGEVAVVPAPPSMRRPRRLGPRHAPETPSPSVPPPPAPAAQPETGAEHEPDVPVQLETGAEHEPDAPVRPDPEVQPVAGAQPERDPSDSPPSGDEAVAAPDPRAEPAAYLRQVAIPEIERLGRRLKAAEHQTRVQDLLDLPEPSLRVLFWPHPGPMSPDAPQTRGTLEIGVTWGDDSGLEGDLAGRARQEGARVRARYWISADPTAPVTLRGTTLDHLDTGWVRNRFLDFVELVLAGL